MAIEFTHLKRTPKGRSPRDTPLYVSPIKGQEDLLTSETLTRDFKKALSNTNEKIGYGADQSGSETTPLSLSSFKPNKPEKSDVHEAIRSIYVKAGLPKPLIISTQSPLGSYIAKAAIDVFSNESQRHSWYYDDWHSYYWDPEKGCPDIRKAAVQSILNSGWRMGDAGTGYHAWDELPVYTGGDTILWEHLPPDSLPRYNRSENGKAWNKFLERPALRGISTAVLSKGCSDEMLTIWAKYKVQMTQPSGGGRSQAIWINRDAQRLLCQKNLSFFPVEITHPETGDALSMTDDFIVLRDSKCHIVPYDNICFVSEPASITNIDNGMRLHCGTGPAILHSDGFKIFSWHGVEFPEDWIKQKPEARQAFRVRNAEQRRVACEMIGWDNVLTEMKANTINKDKDPEIGELVSVKPNGNDEEKFLRVRCGTGREFVIPVPPEMQTARQANAWTWGAGGQPIYTRSQDVS
ncbi:hypothetical protein N9M10_02720 [Hellea sp.]|nr:hypothetical protein [Hellea sp.]